MWPCRNQTAANLKIGIKTHSLRTSWQFYVLFANILNWKVDHRLDAMMWDVTQVTVRNFRT